MKATSNHWTFLALFSLVAWMLPAQSETHHSPDADTPPHEVQHEGKHFRVAFLVGHTFVPTRHSAERLIIPSYGLDLEYWFNHKWGIGLHNDLELQNFVIERGDDEILEREFPIVITLDALFHPWKGLSFQAGPGIELEKNENFYLFRVGAEYLFFLPGGWDLGPYFFYDSRDKVYDTWSLGLGVAKHF